MNGFAILSLLLFATTGAMTVLWFNEKETNKHIRSFFGEEFLRALKTRNGMLFLKVDPSGHADFRFAPWFHKDETFYYIEEPRGEGKEKLHYKVRKKDLLRLRGRLNMAIIFEESISALSPKVMEELSSLTPFEKARLMNAYAKYRSLRATRERLLQHLRHASDREKVEELKEQLKDVEEEMAAIREKWSSIVQEVDLDSVVIIPNEKERKVTILRPIDIDELVDYLEATRPDELIYTAKKMFADWQMTALESLKKLVAPAIKVRRSGFSWLWVAVLAIGGFFLMILLGSLLGGR